MFLSFLMGILTGAIFFGGLYWTLQQMDTVRHPALFMMFSLIVRLAILLGGFYLIMDGRYQNILIALVGVILTRSLLLMKFGRASTNAAMGKE